MGQPGPEPRGGDGVVRATRAVAIGGGHGTARTVRALPSVVEQVTAVVTVADDGGSSGRLRRDLGILPPGDLRMAATAMARDTELAELVAYRFARGELAGHSVGNLMMVALQELAGDPVAALDRLVALLDAPGRVLPCTLEPLTLHAATDGGEVSGQAAIAATTGLRRIWITPEAPRATPEVLAAIRVADMVVLGPGSLYTSLLPNLLVPEVATTLVDASARVVLVGNLREQPGETQGLGLADHLDVLYAHVPRLRIDVVVAHDGPPPAGSTGLEIDVERIATRVPELVTADLAAADGTHDPAALACVLRRLLPG
jgi:uncharacterized cofD-like protein